MDKQQNNLEEFETNEEKPSLLFMVLSIFPVCWFIARDKSIDWMARIGAFSALFIALALILKLAFITIQFIYRMIVL